MESTIYIKCDSLIHPNDIAHLEEILTNPLFTRISRMIHNIDFDALIHDHFTKDAITISTQNHPNLMESIHAFSTFSNAIPPELIFSGLAPYPAISLGMDHPLIVFHTSVLSCLEPRLIVALLAHEMGHVQCGHNLYLSIEFFFQNFIKSFPATQTDKDNILRQFTQWKFWADLSADRVASTCFENPDEFTEALTAIVVRSKLPHSDRATATPDIQSQLQSNAKTKTPSVNLSNFATHLFRVSELVKWNMHPFE